MSDPRQPIDTSNRNSANRLDDTEKLEASPLNLEDEDLPPSEDFEEEDMDY